MCATLLWQHLLCFAAHRYKFWFWKFKDAVPEEAGWFYNRAEREGLPLRVPLLFWKLRRTRLERRTREREECLTSWSSSHLLNSCAAQRASVHKCVNKPMHVSLISCQTQGQYIVIEENVGWSHSTQVESFVLCFYSPLHIAHRLTNRMPHCSVLCGEKYTKGTCKRTATKAGRKGKESSPQFSMITAQLRLNGPSCKQTGPTCQVYQFQKVERWWETDGKAGGRRTEKESRPDLCVKYINCRMSRNDEKRPEWGTDGEQDGRRSGETKWEEAMRKNIPEREQASVSGVSTAGSTVLLTGREGASGRKMWANAWVDWCHSLIAHRTLLPRFHLCYFWNAKRRARGRLIFPCRKILAHGSKTNSCPLKD